MKRNERVEGRSVGRKGLVPPKQTLREVFLGMYETASVRVLEITRTEKSRELRNSRKIVSFSRNLTKNRELETHENSCVLTRNH